jgi:hypothetical protein
MFQSLYVRHSTGVVTTHEAAARGGGSEPPPPEDLGKQRMSSQLLNFGRNIIA